MIQVYVEQKLAIKVMLHHPSIFLIKSPSLSESAWGQQSAAASAGDNTGQDKDKGHEYQSAHTTHTQLIAKTLPVADTVNAVREEQRVENLLSMRCGQQKKL